MGLSPPRLSDWALRYVAKTVHVAVLKRQTGRMVACDPSGGPTSLVSVVGKKGGAGGFEQFSMGSNHPKETPTRRLLTAHNVVSPRFPCRSGRDHQNGLDPCCCPGCRRAEGRTEGRGFPAPDARDPRPAAWTVAPECRGAAAGGHPGSGEVSASWGRHRARRGRRPDLPNRASAWGCRCPRGAIRP